MTPCAMQPSLSSPSVYDIVYIYTKPAKIFSYEKEKSCIPDISRHLCRYFLSSIFHLRYELLTFIYVQFIYFFSCSKEYSKLCFFFVDIIMLREILQFSTRCNNENTRFSTVSIRFNNLSHYSLIRY